MSFPCLYLFIQYRLPFPHQLFIIKVKGVLLFFTLSIYQQFKRGVLVVAQRKGWASVEYTSQGGTVRGYKDITFQRPRREQGVEFGGRRMCEKIHHYMALNQKPDPPIEVTVIFESSSL